MDGQAVSDEVLSLMKLLLHMGVTVHWLVADMFQSFEFPVTSGLTLRTGVGAAVEAAESKVRTVSVRQAGGPAGRHRALTLFGREGGHGGAGASFSFISSSREETIVLLVECCSLGAVNIEPGQRF